RYATFASNSPTASPFYPLSLHDALPILACPVAPRDKDHRGPDPPQRDAGPAPVKEATRRLRRWPKRPSLTGVCAGRHRTTAGRRSEGDTSELQSREKLVCRHLPEKKQER